MDNALELRNVSKVYGNFSLKDLNFILPRGFVMGFIGPNGAGKTTTVKLMMNLVKKDCGEIRIFGMDPVKHELEIKEKIGFVYDESCFYEELTIEEMKNVIRPFYKNWDERLFIKYLDDFQLFPKMKIRQLSKGMKMKFSLAVALSHHAELLVMDEPTSGLDPLVRNELVKIINQLKEDDRKAVFFSTHITSDLEKIADYITIINHGEILLSRPKDELLEQYCLVKGSNDFLQKHKVPFIGLEKNDFGFKALSGNKAEILEQFAGEVVVEKPSLEDILLFVAKGSDQVVSLN